MEKTVSLLYYKRKSIYCVSLKFTKCRHCFKWCKMRIKMGTEKEKQPKNYRVLDLYIRLCEGKVINKAEEAQKFGVDERSIQRDIDDIRILLDDRSMLETDSKNIEYDRSKKGYVMTGGESSMLTNSEILAVSKILLESRAFTKKELKEILDKLVKGCVPIKNTKVISELIVNENFHYVELHQKEYIQERLWEIGSDIYEKNLVKIRYARANDPNESIERVIEPVAILFSEYYFYLNAFIVEKDERGDYMHKYNYPAIFRIDRIKDYQKTGKKFHVTYADRFEEGEFRKRIQFMYAGKLMNVRMKYLGENPEPILDRLPTAQIIEQREHEWIIDAEVYGKGVVMWLLSQGKMIEVLKPDSLRQEMKELLKEMYERYL